MNGGVAVRVRGLGKLYQIGAPPGSGSAYDRLGRIGGQRGGAYADGHPTVWALKDIDLEVPRGHILGVIGRNGSGKSTLMKILARVTAPTVGSAEILGRVGALLQVGAGFHPELSGRDNIALSGAILGMTRQEIRAVQDQIVAFSEIERFLDTPVKHYSSGMYLRLAFAVSAHLEAEIMLVDEVLSVGDATFQAKCLRRIHELTADGRTVLFVSHNMESIRELCDSAVVLHEGELQYAGPAEGAIAHYEGKILGIR